jgi:hypothetical protein
MKQELWETVKKYYLHWWNNDFIGRIPFWVSAPKDDPRSQKALFGKHLWILEKEKFGTEKIIKNAREILRATFYGGLAFPCYFPNFGTDVFSAYLGAEMEFSDLFPPVATGPSFIKEDVISVSWAKWGNPVLTDYSNLSRLQINEDNPYWQKTREFIRYAVQLSQGEFFIGATDIHPSMDSLAVLRGSPQNLCLDLVENPRGVKKAMELLWKVWVRVYEDTYYNLIKNQQEGTTAWINLWAPGKFYPVENDLSLMISTDMYREFFLEELVKEINYLDYSIYHLDGKDALHHLDMILDIPKLNAIQWVAGASESVAGVAKWIPLYKKIQANGKAIIVYCNPDEVTLVIDSLKPEGLLISVNCETEKEARELLNNYGWEGFYWWE